MKKTPLLILSGLGLAAAVGLLIPQPASTAAQERIQRGGTLRLCPFTNQLNLELDPVKDSHVFLMQQLYDGLVKLDKDLSLLPALAEYWTISDSGRTYVFYLRPDARFHNGRAITAEDVKFSLERLLDPRINSPYALNFLDKVVGAQDFRDGKALGVSGFRVMGKSTFQIQWVSPYVSALYLLGMSYCKILPKDLVLAQGRDFFRNPVGTGPFKFGYWMRSPKLDIVGIRLERNEAYFDRKAYLEAVEFSPLFTVDHFMEGEVDIYPFVSTGFADLDCQVREDGALGTTFLGMSCHLAPLDRPEVRLAVAVALDRRTLAKVSFSNESVPQLTDNFIPAKLKGFFPVAGDWEYNPDRARRLLASAGFSDDKEFPELTLFTNKSRRDFGLKVYRELKKELEAVGVSLSHREYKSLREVRAARGAYLVLIEWRLNFPDPEMVVRPLFFSRSDMNVMGYADRRLDEMMEAADVERSFSQRIVLFQHIERQLHNDLPAVPLFSNQLRMALQAWVKGVEVPPLGFFYLDLRKVWLDKER